MSRFKAILLSTCLALLLAVAVRSADNSGRIYGQITTVDGDEFQGLIRWDKNEGSWVDILDGNKDMKGRRGKSFRKDRRKYRGSIRIFGLRVGTGDIIIDRSSAQSGIRFGHIRRLEVLDDDLALIETKSGYEFELSGNSTDVGESVREIVIEDENEGEIELVWDDIEKIEFMAAATDERSGYGERLYGTLETRRGAEFTGFVCWDVDELFATDILDGEEKRRNRKIKFAKIASIERYSSSGARVVLTNGDEMVLRGTNDVDDSNRGIIISDPGFGQVKVDWDEFDRIDFSDAPEQVKYSDFDGGRLLKGTVYTEDGEEYRGTIRWDDDEEYGWEILDGEYRDITFDIEFSKIKEIEKKNRRATIVTVLDGRSFRLSGSNDVDSDNKGIFILLEDGDEVEVDWYDFERVVFE